jgi:two-component system, cell cycle response regulator
MQPDRLFEEQLEPSSVDLGDSMIIRRLPSLRPCRILVVDDDELVRARLMALLRMSQFDVESAASGEEALHVMHAKPCQILLTDWQMPDMDGLTLCRNVRSEQRKGYVYVLMLTVRDSKEDVLAGLAAGADDYVVKGAPIDEILARLEVARRITDLERSLRTSNRENRRLAVTDALTGTNNLRYLMACLPRELSRSRRYGHAMAVLSCDIDGFKQINDRHGHEAGNELLREFVARTERCIRKDVDWLARVGGDEFMIVLPETKVQGANRVAQKLRLAYAGSPVDTHAGPVSFTVSVGVTAVEAACETECVSKIEHLLRAADRGLYASKKLGGDRATAATVAGVTAVATSNESGARNDTH